VRRVNLDVRHLSDLGYFPDNFHSTQMKKRISSTPDGERVVKSSSVLKWSKVKFRTFKERLFEPVDAASLGIFRCLFGFLLCIEFFVISRVTFPEDYINPRFHFTYPLFDLLGLKPLSQPSLWVIFNVLRISTLGIMLGLFTRICLIVFTSTFGYFLFMESTVYTHHYYLIFLLPFLMCFGHSGSTFSLDSLISKKSRRTEVDYWEVFLLRFQICVVFFFGAIAKMNADWLIDAAPLYLNTIRHFSPLGLPLHEKWVAVLFSWGGMLTDLGLAILLATGRWPRLTFLWLCAFNGVNVFMFGLGIKTFPYLMVASYILFLPPALVRDAVAGFAKRNVFKKVLRLGRA
jgi:vitamin K-dependent gamma-carboxylase